MTSVTPFDLCRRSTHVLKAGAMARSVWGPTPRPSARWSAVTLAPSRRTQTPPPRLMRNERPEIERVLAPARAEKIDSFRNWLWAQSAANPSLALSSLFSREIAGNFAFPCHFRSATRPEPMTFQGLTASFPKAHNRELFQSYQGYHRPEQ